MSIQAPEAAKQGTNRAVLLVDVHSRTRDSRAQTMRKMGATVDCVSNSAAAISRYASGVYRLVLIDMGRDVEGAERLASDIRGKDPKQMVAFLVAGPKLISKTLTQKPGAPAAIVATPEAAVALVAEVAGESEFGRKVREVEEQREEQRRSDEQLG